MKICHLSFFCFLFIFQGFTIDIHAQNKKQKAQQEDNYDDFYDPYEDTYQDISWKQKGFEFFVGAGAYFGGKYTANYYNGAFGNTFSLSLLLSNKYRRDSVLYILKEKYPYIDEEFALDKDWCNTNSKYNVAMDIVLGARYRVAKNWYLEASYSFRRVTAENRFEFIFPGIPDGNNDRRPYSNPQVMGAKEDRHYIDFSVGYISQNQPVVKPFVAIGGLFTYVRVKSFEVFIEDRRFDLKEMARNPDYVPGTQVMPNYTDWAGAGYGFSVTAGLKFVVNKSVSLDPLFQLSVASFGNSSILKGYNTALGCNYYAGIRLVMSDAVFVKSVKSNQ